MIKQQESRSTAIFYTCGTCNLKCRYCNIHKSPILEKIDKSLEESFKGDYYFNRVREYFPRRDMLKAFETWGGEPFLKMERFHPTLRKLIDYYPYFSRGFSSTNFSYDTWCDKFFGLMDVFGEYPHRTFNYHLQLSVDGPTEINDSSRGDKVTEKCIRNFDKMIDLLAKGRLPQNVVLTITLKPTLDMKSMRTLKTKQDIIDYYLFFENNFVNKIADLNNENIHIYPPIPNTAVPSPVTVEDGKFFALLVKNCREIEKENKNNKIFKHYQEITPYSSNACQTCLYYGYGYHNCGSGSVNVGFLPDNMVSTCHEGFTQIVEEYSILAEKDPNLSSTITFDKFLTEQATTLCTDDKGYEKHCYKMDLYNQEGSQGRLATDTALIMYLALSGQIEEHFLDESNALKAAIFIQSHTAYCIKDNFNKTGSYTTQPVGLFKLLLNGAMQYIQEEGELKVNE